MVGARIEDLGRRFRRTAQIRNYSQLEDQCDLGSSLAVGKLTILKLAILSQ